MNREILSELSFFLISFASGAALIAAYDIIRVFRRLVRHSVFWVGAEDLLYWAGAGLFLFLMMERHHYGIIRGFSFLGTFAGMLLCQTFLSRPAVWAAETLLRFLFWLLGRVLWILLMPFRIIGRGLKRIGGFAARCLKKLRKILKNALKKPGQADKMNGRQSDGALNSDALNDAPLAGKRIEGKRHESHTGNKKKKKKSGT